MRPWQPALSIAVLATALLTTLLRTLRLPNDWAEAHWLLDYRFGFVKRGLPGELLRWLASLTGHDVGAGAIAAAACTLLGVFALLLLAMAIGIVRAGGWRPGVLAAATALLCSPFVVLTGHLCGYYEHLFFPLGIASVWLAQRGRFGAGALLQVVALLVHESSIVLVFPAFAAAALLRAAHTPLGQRPPSLLPLLLPITGALLMTRVVGAPPADFQAHYVQWLGQHPFVQGAEAQNAPMLLSQPLGWYWELIAPKYGERMAAPGSFGLVLPTLLALLLWLVPRLRAGVLSLPALLLGTIVLLPQAMQLVAFDLERLWTFSLFTAFLATWLFAHDGPDASDGPEAPEAPAEPRGLLPIALLAIVANFVMETPLLDLQVDTMPRGVRAVVMLVLVATLLGMATALEPGSFGERWRLRGRSLWDVLRRR